MNPSLPLARSVRRVRHPLKVRRLAVRRTERLSPGLLRVTLAGPELDGFSSASFDDHFKLVLPGADGELRLPALPLSGDALLPPMRDYTPRRHDAAAGELDIDFVLHGDGPAAAWAARAEPGQEVGVGGPRGSFVVPMDFDWHLLAGDATAMPAIARRLSELPAGTQAVVLLAVAAADRLPLPSAARVTLHWLDAETSLAETLRAMQLPMGTGYAWAAGEASAMAALRTAILERVPREMQRVAAYWKRGSAGHHQDLDDTRPTVSAGG